MPSCAIRIRLGTRTPGNQVRRAGRSTNLGVELDVYWLSPDEIQRPVVDAGFTPVFWGWAARVLPYTGNGVFATIAPLAGALGVQNSTVRHLGAADLTTTVLTLTLTGLAADSALAGGLDAKPHRRLGSIAAMLGGAAAGTAILQWSPSAVIALAAVLAMAVAGAFTVVPRFRVPGAEPGALPRAARHRPRPAR